MFSWLSLENMRQKKVFWIIAFVFGAANAWHFRHSTFTDMVSYLDMGDAFFRGDWATAINSYWSPLYAFLLGLALKVFRPSPYWEFPTVQFVNFLVFMGATASFAFFKEQVRLTQRQQLKANYEEEMLALPDWALTGMGYALFFWSSFLLISTTRSTPDMCVSAFVYLAAGIFMAINREGKGWHWYAGLGGILGLGYLAKAIMFPVGLAFLGTFLLLAKRRRLNLWRAFLPFLAFALVACPLVVSLSLIKGQITFGDAGKLNYAWHVNKVEHWVHWQGGPEKAGTPVHPTRRILEKPAVYEFATPVGGTYPPFHDPTYWYEGVKVKIEIGRLASAIVGNSAAYYDLVFRPQGGAIACLLILFLLGERRRQSLKLVFSQWPLILPALIALGLYSLVDVRERYVGPFVTIFAIGILAGLRMRESAFIQKVNKSISILMIVITLIPVMYFFLGQMRDGGSGELPDSISTPEPWVVSEGLFDLGLRPGDKVATLGSAWKPYWARLSRLQIVAELPEGSYLDYWGSDDSLKQKVLASLLSTGAKAIICTGDMPKTANAKSWRKIGQTSWHVIVQK